MRCRRWHFPGRGWPLWYKTSKLGSSRPSWVRDIQRWHLSGTRHRRSATFGYESFKVGLSRVQEIEGWPSQAGDVEGWHLSGKDVEGCLLSGKRRRRLIHLVQKTFRIGHSRDETSKVITTRIRDIEGRSLSGKQG